MKSKSTFIAVGAGVIIVALVIYFSYSVDQAKIRGEQFGNELKAIQDDLKHQQAEFYNHKQMLDNGTISKDEFLDYSKEHVTKMNGLIDRYGTISIPDSFTSSVKLFKLSTEKQLESDQHFVEWVRTNSTGDKVKSDLLIQESFEDEMAALSSYNKAKNPSDQN